MTNEELVTAIQRGDDGLIPELWEKVWKFVKWRANLFYSSCEIARQRHTTVEDLTQAGYFGFLDAIRYYNHYKPYKFVTYLDNTLKNAFQKEVGLRGKCASDPAFTSKHLEDPVNDDDQMTLLTTLNAVAQSDSIDTSFENMFNQELRRVLECAMRNLSKSEESVIRQAYFWGQSIQQISEDRGCSDSFAFAVRDKALRKMQYGPYRRQLLTFLYCDTVPESALVHESDEEPEDVATLLV